MAQSWYCQKWAAVSEGGGVQTAVREAPSAEETKAHSVALKEKPVGGRRLERGFLCGTGGLARVGRDTG